MVALAVLSPFMLIAAIVMAAWLILRIKNPLILLARVAASATGIYAGLLGLEHGFFETLQGSQRPGIILMYAIATPPCQPQTVWQGCEPAMTLIPNFLITGILAIFVAGITVVWAGWQVHRNNGRIILILLSLMLLFVGGGFFPPLFGIIAGAIGTRMNLVEEPDPKMDIP